MARSPHSVRWGAHIAAIAATVLALVVLSIVAVMAARDERQTAARVRESTSIWNAYQQARYSLVQEALLTQEFRIAGSPAYEAKFETASAALSLALAVVEETGSPADRSTAARLQASNANLAERCRP
jgi:hypothetical protein